MSIFRRKIYLLMSLGLVVMMPSMCMASSVAQVAYGTQINQVLVQDIISENAVFVATNGSDSSGSGSMEKPYATINKALKNIKSGQTIYIKGGVYRESITLSVSGKENAYITICNYPGEDVILDNSGSSNESMINLGGQSYIHIEGLELRNNTNKWAYGFYLGNGESNIIIKNNKIHDLYASKPSSSNSGANAIICYGERGDKPISNILIEGNDVYDCNTGWCEAISITGNCEYVSVINNKVRNTGNIGIDFCGNFGYCEEPSLDQPRYCVARGNIISEANSPYATSYGLYVDGGRDILFEHNIIFDSQGGIEVGAEEPSDYPTQNIIVRNNLVYNNTENGITVGGYYTGGGTAKNVKVYNNTVVNNGNKNGELVISVVDGLEVVNNIFYSEANKALINSEFNSKYTRNISFSHNLYYSKNDIEQVSFEMLGKTTKGFSDWVKTYELTGMFGQPSFKNNLQHEYELIRGSLGIDCGDSSIDAGTVDLANNVRYQGNIDCGAYEYGDISGNLPEGGDTIEPEEPEEPEEPDTTLPDGGDVTVPEVPEQKPDTGDNEEEEAEKIIVLNEINKIQVGDKHFLKVALETSYTDRTLSFTSSDRKIAKVSANGNIQAISEGEVNIMITSAYDTRYIMPLKVVKDINVSDEEDQVEIPEVPSQGEEVEIQNLMPSFKEDVWQLISGYTALEITDDYSISLITPKSWEGISLWGYKGLNGGQVVEIGYNQLGDNNFVQVWADGVCLVDLSSNQETKDVFTIPTNAETIDICIVASQDDTAVQIQGFYVQLTF